MTIYKAIKDTWAALLPSRVRRLVWVMTPMRLKKLRSRLVHKLEQHASHDEIYDDRYYSQLVEPTMVISSEAIAESIVRDLQPESVFDVGCGTGRLLESLKAKGVDVRGLDYAEAAVGVCRRRGLRVEKFNIEQDHPQAWTADVVLSTEVAEHLPESCAERFVDLLTSVSDLVVLTAAAPSELGGTDHVNEQPPDYWINMFSERGYDFDSTVSEQWRACWRDSGVAGCFSSTLMIFRRTSHSPRGPGRRSPVTAAGGCES